MTNTNNITTPESIAEEVVDSWHNNYGIAMKDHYTAKKDVARAISQAIQREREQAEAEKAVLVEALEPFAWFAEVIPSEYSEVTKTFEWVEPLSRGDGSKEHDRALNGKPFFAARDLLSTTSERTKQLLELVRAAEALTNPDIEKLSEAVHKAYCRYKKEVHGEDYWTGGDYSKLSDEWKEADRYTARAILEVLRNEMP